PGCLIAIDLSCPYVTPEGAYSLFTICLSLFLEQHTSVGRVVALDEVYKYMDASVEVLTFTNTLLATIRLQRHLGAQIIVSTQEPTISLALLDLCSVTIVHHFTSPATLSEEPLDGRIGITREMVNEVAKPRVGEALLFAPSAIIGLNLNVDANRGMKKLGTGFLKIRVRARVS
ncbi:hypothetical protein F5882DRAFT_291647, partial [Hyaloscypha sp. PMI_1271]